MKKSGTEKHWHRLLDVIFDCLCLSENIKCVKDAIRCSGEDRKEVDSLLTAAAETLCALRKGDDDER